MTLRREHSLYLLVVPLTAEVVFGAYLLVVPLTVECVLGFLVRGHLGRVQSVVDADLRRNLEPPEKPWTQNLVRSRTVYRVWTMFLLFGLVLCLVQGCCFLFSQKRFFSGQCSKLYFVCQDFPVSSLSTLLGIFGVPPLQPGASRPESGRALSEGTTFWEFPLTLPWGSVSFFLIAAFTLCLAPPTHRGQPAPLQNSHCHGFPLPPWISTHPVSGTVLKESAESPLQLI